MQNETQRKKKVMQRTDLLFHMKARMIPVCQTCLSWFIWFLTSLHSDTHEKGDFL